MASGKSNKTIKNSPEFFSEESQTTEERIFEHLDQQKSIEIVAEDYNQHHIPEDLPSAPTATAEQRISELLDRYYNGDSDVEYNHRFDNKELYKAELIQTLKLYGITYIEKPHYPLSKDEKHVIRMDFFGRINRPHFDRLSPLYQGYLSIKNKNITPNRNLSENKFRKKRRNKDNAINIVSTPMTTYPLKAYDLSISKAWKLYRLFPRFHNLEHKMLQTIQSMHIPPEQLAIMSVYDYSDVLYRTFRESENSPDAHLFLGARHAFIKDVFKKFEPQIRAYLQRKNTHPRYIEALIKAAKSKGVCNNINITSDAYTCMSEYATSRAEDFQNFIIQNIRSDDYAAQIRSRIQNNDYNIEGAALHFLENTEKQFSQFIKKNLLEENYAISLYEQFSRKIPSYVLEDIKGYIKENPQKFAQYLNQLDISPTLQKSMIKRLPDLTDPEQREIAKMFILGNQDNFFEYLLDNCRSPQYANFSLQVLDETPKLTDFGKDMITSFIIEEGNNPKSKLSPILLDRIKKDGLTNEIITEISPYIRSHFSGLQNHLKQNNILTFTELQNELIENNTLLIQNNAMPDSMKTLHKNFILSNTTYFKDWYINFHTQKHKENAAEFYEELSEHGITDANAGICCDFIKERLSSFMEFATQHDLSTTEIIPNLTENKLLENVILSGAIHSFIVRHNATFKNFLLQNHLQQKESNFELMIKKIKQQGLSVQSEGIVHRFIIDNQPLYTEYQRKNKQLGQQTEQIYDRVITNKPTTQDKTILNEYLNNNIYNYMIFQQDNSQLLPYVKNIIQNVKHTKIGNSEKHWLKAYTEETTEQFKQFLVENSYLDKQKSNTLIKNIKYNKTQMIITFNDGYLLKIPFGVHHKKAAQDSGEIKYSNLLEETEKSQAEQPLVLNIGKHRKVPLPKISEDSTLENIARINDFSNLCVFTDFWHRVMHSMDSTEPFEDRERFVARLMPTNPNIVFYGSEKPEDQFSYDYANDQRTKRYNRHLSNLISINKDYER